MEVDIHDDLVEILRTQALPLAHDVAGEKEGRSCTVGSIDRLLPPSFRPNLTLMTMINTPLPLAPRVASGVVPLVLQVVDRPTWLCFQCKSCLAAVSILLYHDGGE